MKTQNTPIVQQFYAPNQFVIRTDNTTIFQSYDSIIVKIEDGKIRLGTKWKFSKTTSKYRNLFLKETTKETEAKIKSGVYTIDERL